MLLGLALLATRGAGEAVTPGQTLTEALAELQSEGLRLVFSDRVVRPDMSVQTAPSSTAPRAVLDEILSPHGLEVRAGPEATLVIVRIQSTDQRTLSEGALAVSDTATPPTAAIIEEQLVVTPSRVSLLQHEPVAPFALSQAELLALPHLGSDFFRALSLLPGVTSNDISAEFHVRGGRRDETQILLDGQELYESFHLQDFDNASSLIVPEIIDSVDLTTGGFQVECGDRMSGVLDIRGSGGVGLQGLTELFFESAEPSFDEQPLEELLALFPAGRYRFEGTSTEGESLTRKARLTHALPSGPVLVRPVEGDEEVDPDDTVVEWAPVADPPGSRIVAYQVIVVQEEPTFREFDVTVGSEVTLIKVPAAFMESGGVYKYEVIAIEKSGNQTLSEREFETE